MKRLALLCMAALGLSLVGCNPEPTPTPNDELQPTIALEKGSENVNYVTFTLTTTNATEARYMVLEDGTEAPTLDAILTEGVDVQIAEGQAEVKAEATPASSGEAVYHTVEAGETMGHIAFKYEGATQKSIEALNPDIDPTKLQIGQKIRVK